MTYLITALEAEARPLIDHYKLKRDFSLPYTLYVSESHTLLITGLGKVSAMISVSALLGYKSPGSNDTLINIGLCGAPVQYKIGEALLIHQIIDTQKTYYPDILYTHPLNESSLICVDSPQNTLLEYPVDMESGAVFVAASPFIKLHQMAFIKIVSDHFEPSSVTKELASTLIYAKLSEIDNVATSIAHACSLPSLFSTVETQDIQRLKSYFTKSQGDALFDALCFFRLRFPAKPLPLEVAPPQTKSQRSQLHENLIHALVS